MYIYWYIVQAGQILSDAQNAVNAVLADVHDCRLQTKILSITVYNNLYSAVEAEIQIYILYLLEDRQSCKIFNICKI